MSYDGKLSDLKSKRRLQRGKEMKRKNPKRKREMRDEGEDMWNKKARDLRY